MIKDLKKTRSIIFLLEIIAIFFISQAPTLIPSLYGVKPNLLLLVAFNIAIFETPLRAIFLGMFCGLFMDLGFGEYFGFYITAVTALCFLFSTIKEKFKRMNIAKAYCLAVFFLFFISALNFTFFYIVNGTNYFFKNVVTRYAISLGYTLSLEFVFYYLAKFIYKFTKIKRKKMKYLMARKSATETAEAYSFLGSD